MLAPYEAVQRADQIDFQTGSLLQNGLHLIAVLANDVGVVAAGFIQIIPHEVHFIAEQMAVQRAEGAKGVGREQNLIGQVIGQHDFGPVDHGSHDKGVGVAAGLQGIAFLHGDGAAVHIKGEKLLQHGLGHAAADDLHFGIAQDDVLNAGSVVRLHMLDNQIVQFTAVQNGFYVFKIVVADRAVYGIKENRLLIQKQVRVVGNTVADTVDAFKHGKTAIVGTDPDEIAGYVSDTMHN